MKTYFYSLLFYTMSAFGISLTILANIGVSSLNSMNVALSQLTTIKVGTITTIINIMFLILCLFLDQHKNIKSYIIMVISLLFFGYVINFFVYYVLSSLVPSNYLIRVVLFISGTLIAGTGTGRILHYGLLKFPIENFCQLLSKRYQHSFMFYRYSIDIICVCLSVLISFTYQLPLYVREGTLISLILLSMVINWSKNLNQMKIKKALD